jgi:hypothetical protein
MIDIIEIISFEIIVNHYSILEDFPLSKYQKFSSNKKNYQNFIIFFLLELSRNHYKKVLQYKIHFLINVLIHSIEPVHLYH